MGGGCTFLHLDDVLIVQKKNAGGRVVKSIRRVGCRDFTDEIWNFFQLRLSSQRRLTTTHMEPMFLFLLRFSNHGGFF